MKQLISALILATSLAAALPATSGEVTLKARDGSMSMTGELISFDGLAYTIRSAIGEVSVDAQQVDCIGADCPTSVANTDIVVSGSKTVGSILLPALVEAFALEQGAQSVRNAGEPGAVSFTLTPEGASAGSLLTVRMPGSAGGVSDLATGNADIAILSRPLTPAEAATLPNSTQQILALDALVPVVAASNSQRSISEQDLAAIFSGGIANWADLGGPDAPINMYMREPTSGTREAFDQIVMDAFIAELADEATILQTDEEIADAVAADPNGIGIVSAAAARNARVLPILGICGIETPATPFTVKTEEYPLSRRILLVRPQGSASPAVDTFLNFATSDTAQFDIADAGFVDQLIEPTPIAEQGARFATAMMPGLSDTTLEHLQSLMADLMMAQRLTVTFRFTVEPLDLDDRAKADVSRLVNLLSDETYAGKEIIIAGFTDSEGSMNRNREQSLARASQIRDALFAAAPANALSKVTFTLKGYGESSPLACNEIASGRAVNRRVEVWVK